MTRMVAGEFPSVKLSNIFDDEPTSPNVQRMVAGEFPAVEWLDSFDDEPTNPASHIFVDGQKVAMFQQEPVAAFDPWAVLDGCRNDGDRRAVAAFFNQVAR